MTQGLDILLVDKAGCCSWRSSSDSRRSDCRNTVFQASPRHVIPSIASVVAASDTERRAVRIAHYNRITVRNPARVTDTLNGSHPNTNEVPATSALNSNVRCRATRWPLGRYSITNSPAAANAAFSFRPFEVEL